MLAPKCPTFNGRPTFANPRLIPDREEILTLEEESRSKLNKDLVKPFDYTKLNNLYDIFKPQTQHYEIQFAQANAIRKKITNSCIMHGVKPFKRPSLSSDTQLHKIWKSLVKKCLDALVPLRPQIDSPVVRFIHELKQEMHADLKYVESLEDELDELESDKAEFSNMYDMLLQECVSKDVMCSYLLTSSDLDEITEFKCL
ncbi:hypothetical protein Tco_0272692 [Tanacetum coccineum]